MPSYNSQPVSCACGLMLTLQLYETYNVYVSQSAYVFEPSSSTVSGVAAESGRLGVNEKDVRESLHVDRRTGQLSLNGECKHKSSTLID